DDRLCARAAWPQTGAVHHPEGEAQSAGSGKLSAPHAMSTVIDAHAHVSDLWYEPAEALLFQMDRHGVERALLVQLLGQFDNRYILACAARWRDRFSAVVALDAERPDAVGLLAEAAAAGAWGVRLRASARSPGDDPLAIWRATEAAGLAVSC